MKLLTTSNPKIQKGIKRGYLTHVMHLAPAKLSGFNVCASSSAGCRKACLNTAGRGGIFKPGETTNHVQLARIARTRWFFEDREAFMAQLVKEIAQACRRADRLRLEPVFRLNGTSDVRWEHLGCRWPVGNGSLPFRCVMTAFPGVRFYDYTKHVNRCSLPPNYSLTFSRSESNESECLTVLERGGNVAVVFDPVPRFWYGWPVVDGDRDDLRFLDPAGVVVGLMAKGRAKRDRSGFVVRDWMEGKPYCGRADQPEEG